METRQQFIVDNTDISVAFGWGVTLYYCIAGEFPQESYGEFC